MFNPQVMNYIYAINLVQHELNESLLACVMAVKTNEQERLDEIALAHVLTRFASLSVPAMCQRLRDDVAHLCILHADVLRFVWDSYAPLVQARYDYMEATTIIDVEIARLVEHYGA